MARLFFALWPGEQERNRLIKALPEWVAAGRMIPPENLHVTLAFLGDLDAEQAASARSVAEGVSASAFSLDFTVLQFWPRARTRVLVPEYVPEAARALRGELARGLREAGVPFDARIWHPHLTVARKARPADEVAMEPVQVGFSEFLLVRSYTEPTGAVYESVARWALAQTSD